VPAGDRPIRIAAESEAVRVRAVETGNGRRLEIRSERTGDAVLLDATVLAALARLGVAAREEIVRLATEGPPGGQRPPGDHHA
jgi:hypothetical protein